MNILTLDTDTCIEEFQNKVKEDFIGLSKKIVTNFINKLLEAEIIDFFEKAINEPDNEVNKRNGYYTRVIYTNLGPLELRVPRDRLTLFKTQILEPYKHRTETINETIQNYYFKGLTLNEISSLLLENLSLNISKETIRKVVNETLGEVEKFNERKLTNCPFIYLDATYIPFKRSYDNNKSSVQKESCMIALGVRNDGKREILGFYFAPQEGAYNWENLLLNLKKRGINDPKLFISDGLQGMPEAIRRIYPNAKHQTCLVHVSRNIIRNSRKSDQKEIANDFKEVYGKEVKTLEDAKVKLNEFVNKWSKTYPRYMKIILKKEGLFTYLEFPSEIRKQIYTSNPIESCNAKFKRESKKRIQFNSENNALINLVKICIDYNKKSRIIREIENIDEKVRTELGFVSLDK